MIKINSKSLEQKAKVKCTQSGNLRLCRCPNDPFDCLQLSSSDCGKIPIGITADAILMIFLSFDRSRQAHQQQADEWSVGLTMIMFDSF
jgi:hypothetical protein